MFAWSSSPKKKGICEQTTHGFCTMITHRAIIIRAFLTKNETNTIQQPSNSPDMAPCDFFLFDRVKKPQGTRFNSRKEVMEKSKTALMAISTIEFQKYFESWIKRHKCSRWGVLWRGQHHFWWIKLVFWIFWMNSGNFLIKVYMSIAWGSIMSHVLVLSYNALYILYIKIMYDFSFFPFDCINWCERMFSM